MKNFLIFISIIVLFFGCKDDPVTPPPPTMSGRWDVTLTGSTGSIAALMDLSEDNGSLSGSFILAGSTTAMSGSISTSYQVTFGGSDIKYLYLITGTANPSKTTFSGKMSFSDRATTPYTYLGYYDMTANKR